MANLYKNRSLSLEEKRVIRYVKQAELQNPDNSPEKSDPRMYLMNLLYYTFGWTDEEIGSLLKRDRTTITSGRKKASLREKIEDKLFIGNTHVLRFMFPDCKIQITKNSKIQDERYSFVCKLTKSRISKLNKLKNDNSLYNYNDAITILIDKYL